MPESGLKLIAGAVKILKNNQPISNGQMAALQDAQVQQELNTPAMFSFTLSSMSEQGRYQDVNLDDFKPGDDIEILMGQDEVQSVIIGKITAVEPSFKDYCSVTIRGFDLMYQLKFGTYTENYVEQPYADIMQQLAVQSKLTVVVEGDPGNISDSVLQPGISNFDFMLELIGDIDYEMLMTGKTLTVRASSIGESAVKNLQYPKDISELNLNLTVPTMGSTVTVTGWDMMANKAISAEISSATYQQKMGGQKSGYQAAESFPESGIEIERPDISNSEALEVVAKSEYQKNLNRFIQGNAILSGDTRMSAGVNIKMSGLSERFDGLYYVTSATHRYDNMATYKTEVRLIRTGA